ncbi:MAG: hypothetical protein ABUU24_07075 [Variovorax sp.]
MQFAMGCCFTSARALLDAMAVPVICFLTMVPMYAASPSSGDGGTAREASSKANTRGDQVEPAT